MLIINKQQISNVCVISIKEHCTAVPQPFASYHVQMTATRKQSSLRYHYLHQHKARTFWYSYRQVKVAKFTGELV